METPSRSGKHYVFVCGAGRSGTSALVGLLDSHSRVCVGMERYKAILRDERRIRSELDASLFEADRFFSFQPRDTNIDPASIARFAPLYEAMRQRFPRATHVGDKVPHLFVHYDAIADRLPGAHFVYIVRDVSDVANSWNKRAADPADPGWGADSDYRKAVQWWNRGNRETLAFAARGGSVRVVEYEKLWSGDERYLSALFGSLQLEVEPECLAEYRRMVATGARYAKLPRLLKEGQHDFVRVEADLAARDLVVARHGLRLD